MSGWVASAAVAASSEAAAPEVVALEADDNGSATWRIDVIRSTQHGWLTAPRSGTRFGERPPVVSATLRYVGSPWMEKAFFSEHKTWKRAKSS